jgi:RNA recognition motif-containing protein
MQGCGIVEYSTKDEAQNAINTMSNRNLMGRLIYVREVSQNRSLATHKHS